MKKSGFQHFSFLKKNTTIKRTFLKPLNERYLLVSGLRNHTALPFLTRIF